MGHQARGPHPLLRSRLRHALHVLYPGFAPRRRALSALSLLSMFFVLALVATGFYLVVPVALLPHLAAQPWPTAFWLAVFLWSIACTLVSYLLTAVADPGRVPHAWRPVAWLPAAPPPPDPRTAAGSASPPAPAVAPSPRAVPPPAHTAPPPSAAGAAVGTATHASAGDAAAAKLYPQAPADVAAAGTAMVRPDGRYRFCVHCNVFKPDRAHHCSSCKECVLQMDHHCPFTGNSCVGLLNRKFFVLFLYYATLSCGLVAGLTPRALGRAVFADPDEPLTAAGFGKTLVLLMGYVMCSLHAVALAPFSAFHTYLVLKNRTTIENQEVRQPLHIDVLARGDRGWLANWKAVFGPRPWLWFVPVSYGREWDGLRWTPARPVVGDELV